jgi:hypothetical protein
MKKIDPTERALDAYFQLDTDQKATFALALKHVERFTAQIGRAAEQTTPTRGRPKGSKNRKANEPQQVELVEKLFGQNGAVTEGL